MKTSTILFVILMSLTNICFAGEITQFCCDKCGFESDPLPEGCGMAGIKKTIVYCGKCKDFRSLDSAIAFKTELNNNAVLVKPAGKVKFLGKERLVYPCPECGSKAFVYDGPLCPHCFNGKLNKKDMGLWD